MNSKNPLQPHPPSQVSVLFIFNGVCRKWERELPKQTLASLMRDRDSAATRCVERNCSPGVAVSLADFPCVPSSEFKFAPRMVAMMANLSSWAVQESRDKIMELLLERNGEQK